MVNLGKDEDTCEDREHWGGWRILRQMKSLGKAGARHCEISICTCFSLDSELVPEMENAKADTSASEIQGFCDPGQGRGELYSPEIRHSIAALLEFMWAGKEFTFTGNEAHHWYISPFEAGLVRGQTASTSRANQKEDKHDDLLKMRTCSS